MQSHQLSVLIHSFAVLQLMKIKQLQPQWTCAF